MGPLLFILYIDSLHHSVIHSSLKIFGDDMTVYRVVSNASDCQFLQENLTRVFDWTVAWQVRLNPAKCQALNLSNKRFPPQFVYAIGGKPISWKSLVRYLGVHINSRLTWSDHCRVTDWDPAILKWTKSSNDCVLELHWPSLASRQVFLTCLFVFKILHE